MNGEVISIANKETKVFDDLSITNLGIGHKILMSPSGGRGGDLLFAEIELHTPRVPATSMRLFASEDEKTTFTFDTYHITTEELPDNAQSVLVRIERESSS
jgi:hypothetical protein